MTSFPKLLLACLVCLFLAACESAEEKAEKYYQSGLALIEEGDTARAMVELRNVFEFNNSHREARQTYAQVLRETGNIRGAYRQYLRLVEQYPDDLDGRVALSEISFDLQDWEEFERHSTAVTEMEIAETTPAVETVRVLSTYRNAVIAEDGPARRAVLDQAAALLEEQPDNFYIMRVLMDGYAWDGRPSSAMQVVDQALVLKPEQRDLYGIKLTLLSQFEDEAGIEAVLRDMTQRFPEDDSVKAGLIRFYTSRGRLDDAETYLRENSDPADEDPAIFLSLLQLIEQTKGEEALLAELDRGIETGGDNTVLFRGLKANVKFIQGNQDAAIADLNALLAEDNPASDNLRNVKILLARMENTVGNNVGARRLVEEVLAEDSGQSDALHMQARWLIDTDEVDAAISALRTALQSNDRDAQAMTLMAEAYTRAGDHELALDFLSRAAEASGNAPAETLRYVRRLVEDERYPIAEDQLISSLRIDPGNMAVLTELGELYLRMDDTARARQVVQTLNGLDNEQASGAARALDLALMARTGNMDNVITTLQGMAGDTENPNRQAAIAIIRARLANGEGVAAAETAREFLESNPQDNTMRYVLATTLAAIGENEEAEEGYRALLEEFPEQQQLRLSLIRLVFGQGRAEEGKALIEEGLSLTPDQPDLLWAKASYHEQAGEIDAAIGIYEALYERNSASVVVANNLASLISTYRDDPESTERAYVVARRLRGSEVPAFQDTYGWLAYKRGEYLEAVEYLEAAATGLPDDAMVQAHLGFTYLALERRDAALETLRRAVDIAGEGDQRDRIKQAREEIERLSSPVAE